MNSNSSSTSKVSITLATKLNELVEGLKSGATEIVTGIKDALNGYVKVTQRIAKEKEQNESTIPLMGYLIFSFRLYWEENRNRAEYAGMELPDALAVFLGIPKTKNGLNRPLSCANAYRLVHAGLMSHATYSVLRTDTLCAISETLNKVNGDINHPSVLEAVAIANGPSEKKAKDIRGVKDRIKTDDDGKVTGFLTADEAEAAKTQVSTLDAIAAVDKLIKAGRLGEILNTVEAHVATASDDDLITLVDAVGAIGAKLAGRMTEELYSEAYTAAYDRTIKANAKPELVK